MQPTAHYAMGGIPTDVDGRVVLDTQGTVLDGMYAAGEVACVSVHGANRLGTNSLVDLVVFGRRSGKHMVAYCNQTDLAPLPDGAADEIMAEFERIRTHKGAVKPHMVREKMQKAMTANVGVFRTEELLQRGKNTLRVLQQEYRDILVDSLKHCQEHKGLLLY